MEFNLDKEYIEWFFSNQTKGWSKSDFEIQHHFNKKWFDPENLVSSDLKNVQNPNYKQELLKIIQANPHAYYHFSQYWYSNVFSELFPTGKKDLNYASWPKGVSDVNRLTEEERVKWIKRLGKAQGTPERHFKEEWIESEKLQWIVSKQETYSYWLNVQRKSIEEQKKYGIPKKDQEREHKWERQNQYARENIGIGNSETYVELLKNNKWIKFSFPEYRSEQFEIKDSAKNSTEVLQKIFWDNSKIYSGTATNHHSLFSVHEPKSNFNLINSLLNKHWKDYYLHGNGRDFIKDIKWNHLKDPEVEILGFWRYPKLEYEKESKKDISEQNQKFESPKMKM
ncbi:hypothetical protein [Mesomycoplasma ovipneumoniae]|uniref:hypothetical protein n=1 Tax=Mesomycoplasma ovipneumoniae TaxID=29562 RepID=UPI002964AFE8|nr:hypothetical protein [Mesomycoplasma ovipneumoniae]MDW2891223.1 hypothetical protein [Mesomycoplasma ovipneumoniae]